MRPRLETIRTIAAHELHAAARGRMVPAAGLLFAGLALGIALAGLGASGRLMVQGFTRTGASLLALALYLLPLFGLVLGAGAFGDEDGGTELMLAQPVGRTDVLHGRVLGLAAAFAAVATAGFAVAGAIIAARAGAAGIGDYLLVAAGSLLAGLAGLSVGTLIGALCRRRGAAVGWALALWLAAAVLYDLAAITVLQTVGTGRPGPWLVGLLALNPIDGLRALGLLGLGADVLLGPTGAALRQYLGGAAGAVWVLGSVAAWIALPILALRRVYGRRDF